ncbi:Uncharacterised protein [Mycobacteroides abscessus subsp. bolletii]|nr:Uncharacterised protein [Mycobacteroides abscessus subsp. bolletii]SKH06241.1 Uncharacterised protein [Mycobacteroides abscessus subsp. bolletii]
MRAAQSRSLRYVAECERHACIVHPCLAKGQTKPSKPPILADTSWILSQLCTQSGIVRLPGGYSQSPSRPDTYDNRCTTTKPNPPDSPEGYALSLAGHLAWSALVPPLTRAVPLRSLTRLTTAPVHPVGMQRPVQVIGHGLILSLVQHTASPHRIDRTPQTTRGLPTRQQPIQHHRKLIISPRSRLGINTGSAQFRLFSLFKLPIEHLSRNTASLHTISTPAPVHLIRTSSAM